MPFCASCGQPVAGSARFCAVCGQPVRPGYSQSVPDASEATPPPGGAALGARAAATVGEAVDIATRGSRLATTLLSGVLVIAVLGGGYFGERAYQRAQVVGVVEKFFTSADKMDINGVINCCDPSIERTYKAAGNITAGLIKVNPYDVAELFPALFAGLEAADVGAPGMHVRILEIARVDISGSDAVVLLRVETTMVDEHGRSTVEVEKIRARLKRFDVGWRIVE